MPSGHEEHRRPEYIAASELAVSRRSSSSSPAYLIGGTLFYAQSSRMMFLLKLVDSGELALKYIMDVGSNLNINWWRILLAYARCLFAS